MKRIPWYEIPGQWKITEDFLDIKEDCPHKREDGSPDNETHAVAFGDPLSGGVLYCMRCEEFTGTWDIEGFNWREKYNEQLDLFRGALARYMLHRFRKASVQELLEFSQHQAEVQAETGFSFPLWLEENVLKISE